MIDKTVLITGASRGIGRAIAKKFAGSYDRIALNYKKSADEMKNLSDELRGINPNILDIQADLSDYAAVEEMFRKIKQTYGDIDVLINNAGIAYYGLFSDMRPEEWENIFRVNTFSIFNCCSIAVPGMVRRKDGVIINISSIWGNVGASCEAVYSASKGAVNSFTKALAKELAPSSVRVNAIACGVVDTHINDFLAPEEKHELVDSIPSGRFGDPSEIADLAFFLAHNNCHYMTGQILTVDGGLL